ncbi:hypothetical protein DQW50_15670 [Halorubrum sp. 48-1-W]|uniref:PAS domain-containing protein n=1 Tax=Halorubrum sp. 48-1-W TaxID=2249761 RepID=UPI000DCE582C|nr:PAS domain-containing protein [Halorubrum sp. 48-1-W]RAW44189.1 hypothetical protein DQW50_15670 [Halorubrum sp. 48-1-W]
MTRSGASDVDPASSVDPEPAIERSSREGNPAPSASTAVVDEALKTRTMDEAPVGITIADATRSDMPLIYANAAFERITEYSPSYAVGRNCRFLQGEATCDEPVHRMRTAIENGEATTVELRNYRRSGELFWNEVTIAPLRDDDGEVVHYVGFQQDITRRKRAERAAATRATRIDRERVAQEHLLERIDGVVTDVSEAVTRASSLTELERDVAARLADTYAGAWVGRHDPVADAIVPQVAEGTTDPDVVGRRFPLDGTAVEGVETVIADAIEGRYVHIEPVGSSAPEGTAAVAGVPLHFGDATYGAIAVYVRTTEFHSHERDVLTALGRTVATGINAIESHRTLHDDEVVEFRLAMADHPLVDLADVLSCRLRYVGTVGDRTVPSMLFELDDATEVDAETVRTAVEGTPVTVHGLVGVEQDVPVIELSIDEDPLHDLLREYSGELCDWAVDGSVTRVTLAVGREALARSLADAAMERFEHVDLVGYQRCERRRETHHAFVSDLKSRLTDRQHAALLRAHTAGYFEWPHGTSGDDLAESMGVSRSTFHQHLRAAERKLTTALFER